MSSERVSRVLRGILLAALAVHVVLFVYVVARRFTFPYQTEWMTGSVLDHIERVRNGQPVYTEPSASWIAYIYPPLYLWIGAALGGGAIACRAISIVATLVQAVCVHRIARDLGVSRFWALAAVGLFFGCFPYCGWWYDLERSDPLFGAMMLVLVVLLFRAKNTGAFFAAGVLAMLGVLAKQQAVFYAAAAGAALLFAARTKNEERPALKNALVFGITFVVLLVISIALLEQRSHGWFLYYFYRMPKAHGVAWPLAPDIAAHDIGQGFVLVGATLAAIAIAARNLRTLPWRTTMFVAMLAAGFFAAMSSRLHVGGWFNVLQPWTAFASIAIVWVASRFDGKLVPLAVTTLLVVAQAAVWLYDPRNFTPRPHMEETTARLHDLVHRLETKGEVIFVGRGHVTRQRHFQMSGLADVVRVDGHSPQDLVDGLERQRYAAILDDARLPGDAPPKLWPAVMLEDVEDLEKPLLANYFIGERVDESLVDITMRAPAAPRWVYFPRKHQLSWHITEMKQRQAREMALADKRAAALARGETPAYSAEDIERLAWPDSQ